MAKAGTWTRVSTKYQDETSQQPDIARWCETHGYDITAEYVVHGFSAYKGSRKFDRMWAQVIDDFRTGKINVLVVWKTDRIDRKLQTFQMLQQVADVGGRVEFVTQPHLNDLTTMGGRIALKVQEEIAYAESKDKGDRVRIAQDNLRRNGSLVGPSPWGYRIEGVKGSKRLVPDSDGEMWIPRIFQWVLDGDSLKTVAAKLDAAHVPTRRGGQWSEVFIANKLIRNPVYMGQRRNNGTLETQPLVSPSVWQEANAVVKARARLGRSTVKQEPALLKPECGHCGAKMYRILSRYADGRRYFYRCRGHAPKYKGCGLMVPLAELDGIVNEAKLSNHQWHYEYRFVPGDDLSDRITAATERSYAAMKQGDFDAAQAAMQEAAGLKQAPRSEPHWVEQPTGETEAEWYAKLDAPGRRAYLATHRVIVSREDDGHLNVTIGPRNLGAALK